MKKQIDNTNLTYIDIKDIIDNKKLINLSKKTVNLISKSRAFLDSKISNNDQIIYGVNTGFGSLRNKIISKNELALLQNNLIVSHACGTGKYVPKSIVKLMILLKIKSLSMGYSAVSLEVVELLTQMFNKNILPVVYTQGSLGASGDLAPLAHLSLPLIEKGEVYESESAENFNKISSVNSFKKHSLSALKLRPKDGLALLNGTQFMSAYGIWSLINCDRILILSDLIASISLDAFNCRIDPFDISVSEARPHKGHLNTIKNINKFLEKSEIVQIRGKDIQDPYSFRCIPQVHGASKDAFNHVKDIVHTEINSVTDNPLVFSNKDKVISAGNFHGQSLALAFDYLSMAISEIGSISERRIFKLISGERDLPAFLIDNAGLNSGFMITQYTAASIVNQNKQLSFPNSVDSIVSSNGQEDHVSMGANSATKLYEIIENTKTILAIELLVACQGLEIRIQNKGIKTSPFNMKLLESFRKEIPFVKQDCVMKELISNSEKFLNKFDINFSYFL